MSSDKPVLQALLDIIDQSLPASAAANRAASHLERAEIPLERAESPEAVDMEAYDKLQDFETFIAQPPIEYKMESTSQEEEESRKALEREQDRSRRSYSSSFLQGQTNLPLIARERESRQAIKDQSKKDLEDLKAAEALVRELNTPSHPVEPQEAMKLLASATPRGAKPYRPDIPGGGGRGRIIGPLK